MVAGIVGAGIAGASAVAVVLSAGGSRQDNADSNREELCGGVYRPRQAQKLSPDSSGSIATS
jgi:hypothetical protein